MIVQIYQVWVKIRNKTDGAAVAFVSNEPSVCGTVTTERPLLGMLIKRRVMPLLCHITAQKAACSMWNEPQGVLMYHQPKHIGVILREKQ